MSQHHIHVPAVPPTPVSGWKITAMLAVILAACVVCVLLFNRVESFRAAQITTPGTILEIRQAPEAIIDSNYGGKILYRREALVRFTMAGQQETRWLRLTDSIGGQNLTIPLAAHPGTCIVTWPARHPEHSHCALQ